MIIEGNKIKAENGLLLRRKSDYYIAGEEVSLGYTYYLDGSKLDEPILEIPEHYEEISREVAESDKTRLYPLKVEQYIREKYSISDELAIQRKREENKLDFQEYYSFCEDCKKRARYVLGINY